MQTKAFSILTGLLLSTSCLALNVNGSIDKDTIPVFVIDQGDAEGADHIPKVVTNSDGAVTIYAYDPVSIDWGRRGSDNGYDTASYLFQNGIIPPVGQYDLEGVTNGLLGVCYRSQPPLQLIPHMTIWSPNGDKVSKKHHDTKYIKYYYNVVSTAEDLQKAAMSVFCTVCLGKMFGSEVLLNNGLTPTDTSNLNRITDVSECE